MRIIQDSNNEIFFSQISLFEITIKRKAGKLPAFDVSIEDLNERALDDGFAYLPIQNQHLFNYKKIPLNESHRDPFDRLLIATVLTENAIILSGDEKFKKNKEMIQLVWSI